MTYSTIGEFNINNLQIYEGNVLLYNVTGTAAPPPFEIPSGLFRVVFDSDAILTGKGFSLKYSVGKYKRHEDIILWSFHLYILSHLKKYIVMKIQT